MAMEQLNGYRAQLSYSTRFNVVKNLVEEDLVLSGRHDRREGNDREGGG